MTRKERRERTFLGEGGERGSREGHMGPGESTQQHSCESLGQETPTLLQYGLFCSCRTDFISA